MTKRSVIWATAALAALDVAACKTTDASAPASAGEATAVTPAPSTTGETGTRATGGTGGSGGGGTSIPTLVNVNLQNVLNNLSVSLKINRDNIPVTAQVPIDVAASVRRIGERTRRFGCERHSDLHRDNHLAAAHSGSAATDRVRRLGHGRTTNDGRNNDQQHDVARLRHALFFQGGRSAKFMATYV